MTDAKETSVIEKIKKLFAVAQRGTNNDGSSNEAEASAAMAMAQTLLTRYNLDLKTIQDSVKNTPGGSEELGAKREQAKVNRSAMYRWQQQFWKGLAEANYCFHWTTTVYEEGRGGRSKKVRRHVILGSEVNVAAVLVMGDYLVETMERLLPYPNVERLSKSAISWREGCAERLIERIQAKIAAMKADGVTSEGTSCTALAVRNLEQAEYAANYDAKWGAGSWARHLASEADYNANSLARTNAQRAREAKEAAALAEMLSKETLKQREAREAKEARQAARDDARWYRHCQRENERLDQDAFDAGRRKANTVSLNDQIKGGQV